MLSVIIPNYNHERYLQKRIETIVNQTFQDFEIIILDDCSTDNSKRVIEEYRRHQKVSYIVYNEVNSGSPFIQWEKGIMLAKGDWVWIAESDDWADLEFLQVLTRHIHDPEVGIIYSNSYLASDSGEIINPYFTLEEFSSSFKKPGNEFMRRYMLNSNSVPNASAVIFRKKRFACVGDHFKTFKVNGDWLFWVELMKDSKIVYESDTLNYFRTHPQNVRAKTYHNGVYLAEVFSIQKYISMTLAFDASENRELKYNMLNRMISGLLYYQVNLSPQQFLACFNSISAVSKGVIFAALRTFWVLHFKKR